MLNRLLIAWIVYAGVMGFAVGGSFVAAYLTPPPQHDANTYSKQSTSDQDTKAKSDEALARYTLWLTTFTGILAFATVGLGIATVGLYAAGEKQFRLAQDEFISSHRPRVILRDVIWEGYADIHYTLVNIGETRATIIESWVLVEFVQQGFAVRPLRSFGHDDLGRIVLSAGEMREFTCAVPGELSVAMKYPDIRRIGIDGKEPVFGERYFTGTIVYIDDTGIRRQSVFRRIRDDKSRSFVRLANERDQEYAD
jgi:hypothetical protein